MSGILMQSFSRSSVSLRLQLCSDSCRRRADEANGWRPTHRVRLATRRELSGSERRRHPTRRGWSRP
eukprot:6207031-Pleurochrysis_carterae.AAC.2